MKKIQPFLFAIFALSSHNAFSANSTEEQLRELQRAYQEAKRELTEQKAEFEAALKTAIEETQRTIQCTGEQCVQTIQEAMLGTQKAPKDKKDLVKIITKNQIHKFSKIYLLSTFPNSYFAGHIRFEKSQPTKSRSIMKINLNNLEENVANFIINYLRTKTVPLWVDNSIIEQLYQACDYYLLADLKEKLPQKKEKKHIQITMDTSNYDSIQRTEKVIMQYIETGWKIVKTEDLSLTYQKRRIFILESKN